MYLCWQNNSLLWFQYSALYMTALDTAHLKCQFSAFSLLLSVSTQHPWYLQLWSSYTSHDSHFFLSSLSWSSCVWSLNQPRHSGRTEENRFERRGGLRRWFFSANCIRDKPSVPACCCPYGCENMPFWLQWVKWIWSLTVPFLRGHLFKKLLVNTTIHINLVLNYCFWSLY